MDETCPRCTGGRGGALWISRLACTIWSQTPSTEASACPARTKSTHEPRHLRTMVNSLRTMVNSPRLGAGWARGATRRGRAPSCNEVIRVEDCRHELLCARNSARRRQQLRSRLPREPRAHTHPAPAPPAAPSQYGRACVRAWLRAWLRARVRGGTGGAPKAKTRRSCQSPRARQRSPSNVDTPAPSEWPQSTSAHLREGRGVSD